MTNEKSHLLPSGFFDLLFNEAETNHRNLNILIDLFLKSEYRLIKTPLVEFKEVFSDAQTNNSFKTTDVLSGKDLVFRNDITPQIARLIATRLKDISEQKLKLCYVGDVLSLQNESFSSDRQLTQVGIEIINPSPIEDDLEVISTILQGLIKIGAKQLSVDFSLPYFLNFLSVELKINDLNLLQELVVNKNLSLIKKFFPDHSKLLCLLVTSNNNLQEIEGELNKFLKLEEGDLAAELDLLKKLLVFVKEKFPEIKVTFDLFGDGGFSYHERISFDIFAGNLPYPVARGGGYKISEKQAVGATIYINNLRKI